MPIADLTFPLSTPERTPPDPSLRMIQAAAENMTCVVLRILGGKIELTMEELNAEDPTMISVIHNPTTHTLTFEIDDDPDEDEPADLPPADQNVEAA